MRPEHPRAHRFRPGLVGVLFLGLGGGFAYSSGTPRDAWRAGLESGIEAFDQAQQLLATNPQRARQLFRAAAQHFESIAATGLQSGPLEYNLGNCYLQAGDVGRAILHYRRAQRFIPNAPKLEANLREARRRCLTSIPLSRERRFLHDVFFWHYHTTEAQRLGALLTGYVLFWLSLTLRTLMHRRWLSGAAWVAALLAVACAASLAIGAWVDRNSPQGVITSMDVPVHKGPGTGYQRQFEQPLQSGTEFTRIGGRAGWWEIELPDGQSGWIDASTAALIQGNNS